MDNFGSSKIPASRLVLPKESNWDMPQHQDVYMPMLSVSELSPSDLKLHEQWIVKRKRIIYFLTIITVAAVCLCAVSMIYVLPQFYGEAVVVTAEGVTIQKNAVEERKADLTLEDYQLTDEGSIGFPTLVAEDIDSLLGSTDVNEGYKFCVLSVNKEYRKFTNSCNGIVFNEIEDSDLSHYYPSEGFDVNNIEYVRLTSPVSETLVQRIAETFPNMQKLTVSIDKLCYGSEKKDRDHLPKVELPQLENLEIVNATLCPLTSWLLQWNLPSIEKISITQADIPSQIFENLTSFIQQHNATLITVTFDDCFLGDCNVFKIPLNKNLTIVESNSRNTSAYLSK